MKAWLIPALIGLCAGTFAGMGVGGGALLIPALTIFLKMNQRDAQCVNLLFFLPAASVSVIIHLKNKKVHKTHVRRIMPHGIAGTLTGALLAMAAGQELLRTLFGYFLLALGVYEFFRKDKETGNGTNQA